MSGLLTRRPVRYAVGLAAPLVVLGWWQWQASKGGTQAVTFASLGTVIGTFRDLANDGTLLSDVTATLGRTFVGLCAGAALGIASGVAMGMAGWIDRLLSPLLNALRQVPMIGWLPLIGLWLGTGDTTQLIVIAMAAFFPALLNAHAGVAQVEPRYLDVAGVLRFTAWQRFRHVLLPAAMPLILTGLTQALAFAWIAAIGTEILIGAGNGLGVTMAQAQGQQRLDIVLVAVAVTAALGFILNQSVLRLRGHVLRWQPASR